MNQPPPHPVQPPQAPGKKGIPAIAWVGMGCGGLLIVGVIAVALAISYLNRKIDDFTKNPEKAAAEMVVSMNPDLKKISQNDETGEMTIRTKEGEEITLSYKEISEGRFMVKDKDGNVTQFGSTDLSKIPSWVPQATDLKDAVSLYHGETAKEISGQFSGKSIRSAKDLEAELSAKWAASGISSNNKGVTNVNGTSIITLNYSDEKRKLQIVITEKSGSETLVNTFYSENK
jgi:hypothetical protein